MEINKQKLPTLVKEKSLNGIIEKKQETLSKAKRIILGVLVLVILSAFLAVFWCLIVNKPKGNLPIDIAEQAAIKKANQFLQQKCEADFIGIEKTMVSRTLIYTAGEVCSGLGDYASKYSEIWAANYSLKSSSEEDKSINIAVLVGINGNFICGYAIDLMAAPGILNLDEVCGKKVVVATDKIEYEKGEIVNIEIKNNLDSEIRVGFPPYSIEKLDNGTWIEIKTVFCPCEALCKVGASIIQSGGMLKYQWNQKESWCSVPERISETISNQVPVGIYRIRSIMEDSDKREAEVIYSPEFTIKEKTTVDSRCNEKAQGFGLCKAYFEGYEFDLESGKCVKKGVSGCSAKVPFKTLEECQKTCETEVDFYSCVQGSDCIKVKADCCGCNAGGSAAAINKNFKNQWKSNCNEVGIACPAVMSNDPSCFQEPECVNNKCVLNYPDVSFNFSIQ